MIRIDDAIALWIYEFTFVNTSIIPRKGDFIYELDISKVLLNSKWQFFNLIEDIKMFAIKMGHHEYTKSSNPNLKFDKKSIQMEKII